MAQLKDILAKYEVHLLAVLVVLCNPALYLFNRSAHSFSPDTLAYITLGRDLINSGQLFIMGWGHIDTGLVLPPVYPALIGLGSLLTPDLLGVAERVAVGSFVLATIVLFLLCRAYTNSVIAVLTCLVAMLNFQYFELAYLPLTESTFVLLMACALMTWHAVHKEDGRRVLIGALVLGVLTGVVALTRQIGAFLPAYLVIFTLLWALLGNRDMRVARALKALAIFVGFLAVFLPYAVTIFIQTDYGPWHQSFRMGTYSVTVPAGSNIAALVNESRTRIVGSYGHMLVERREQQRLISDASEMQGFIQIEGDTDVGAINALKGSIINPIAYSKRILRNLLLLRTTVGDAVFFMFLITLLTSVLVWRGKHLPGQLLLPGFLASYLCGLSVFAGTADILRYVQVLVPFMVIQLVSEVYRIGSIRPIPFRGVPVVMCACVLVVVIATTPKYFTSLELSDRKIEQDYAATKLRQVLPCDEPVFSIFPLHAYLVGGRYRMLPNDQLDRVVTYAQHTGVRYLLISRTGPDLWFETRLYRHAGWFVQRSLHEHYPMLLEHVMTDEFGDLELYRIRGVENTSVAASRKGYDC